MVMKLVDVHAHLEHSKFDGDLDEVVRRFVEGGGELIINSGTDPGRNRRSLELAERYGCVRCSFGMYPMGHDDVVAGEWAGVDGHAGDGVGSGGVGGGGGDGGGGVGSGGFGLDVARGRGDFEKQEKLFRKMLGLAKRIGKPVVIHSRKAELKAIEILEEEEMKDVVMHCFCGDGGLIERCVENGWSFSVPPAIMRWNNFKVLVEMVPLGQLLTETDSPYLSAVVGERNEPVNVLVTLKEIARIKGVSVEEVGEAVWGNAVGLFKI